jgi:AcrR family transcriptional regulator
VTETIRVTDSVGRRRPGSGSELRERRRQRMAATIEQAALELFAEHGFASVTVDDIAGAADISRRTFFRYFATKEDVLFGDPQTQEQRIIETLREQPANRSAVEALHDCLVQLTRAEEAHANVTKLRLEVLERSPDIMASAFRQRLSIQRNVAPVLAERMGTDATRDMRPFLISSVSMTAMYVGLWYWLVNGTAEPLDRVVARALSETAAGLAAAEAKSPSTWTNA